MTADARPVGVVGLGSMGTAYAHRLMTRGLPVVGFDPDDDALDRHRAAGGVVAGDATEVASRCEVVVTAVDSVDALDAVTRAIGAGSGSGWVIDTNTVSRELKERARDVLAAAGWSMLDCTVSGGPSMVLDDSHALFASGGHLAEPRVRQVLGHLASTVVDLGTFGNASTAKLIVNHLLTVHNAAAAEAMSLGRKAGLPVDLLYDVVTASGGSSRMFEIRGKAMVHGHHPASTAFEILVDKDGVAIGELARSLRHPLPLFATAYQLHMVGLAQGWGGMDPSVMSVVHESLSGQRPQDTAPEDVEPATPSRHGDVLDV